MMTLAKRENELSDAMLLKIMVEAYPIMVYTKQLADGSRRILFYFLRLVLRVVNKPRTRRCALNRHRHQTVTTPTPHGLRVQPLQFSPFTNKHDYIITMNRNGTQ